MAKKTNSRIKGSTWERLARVAVHPTKIAIIENVSVYGETSASKVARDLKMATPSVAYHARELRDAGVLKVTRSVPRRGATEHFFKIADG